MEAIAMVPVSDIVEVCEDFIQEEIDSKGLLAVKSANLRLLHAIMNVIEDSAVTKEPNILKSNFKKPEDYL